MSNKAMSGYLAIGDITGFTSYVAQTELEHSQAILAELLELIIHRMEPTLKLAKLEGDAVFCYAPQGNLILGATLLDIVENIYLAFRDRVQKMEKHTTCGCKACAAIPILDLKFFVHYGDFIEQHVSGHIEVIGSSVNLVHRLMKNAVTKNTGWGAYTLLSDASAQQMGLETEDLHHQVESYEHLGDISTYSIDLHERYKELVEARRDAVDPDDADILFTFDFDLPLHITWQWLTDPHLRSRVNSDQKWMAISRPGGRITSGAQSHCAHGKNELSSEIVLDVRPFEYITVAQSDVHKPGAMDSIQSFYLESLGSKRTRMTVAARWKTPGLKTKLFTPFVKQFLLTMYRKTQKAAQADLQTRQAHLTQVGETP